MSIATAITNLQGKIANAYTAIQEKGGTLPQVQNAANLSATIADIPSGGAGSKWGMTLDEICYVDSQGNGSILGGISGDLNFPGVKKTLYDPFVLIHGFSGMFSRPNIRSATFPDLIEVINGGMASAFYRSTDLTAVSFPVLSVVTTDGMNSCFKNCTSLSAISFPELTHLGDKSGGRYATDKNVLMELCYGCTSLTAASFPKLSSTYGNSKLLYNTFYNCSNLVSVSFPALQSVVGDYSLGYTFGNCVKLSTVEFPELTYIGGKTYDPEVNNTFRNCTSLISVSFPKLSNCDALYGMFISCTSLTSVSMPMLTGSIRTLTSAFAGCTSLSSLSIPVSYISSQAATTSAFANCSSLTAVSFPNLSACHKSGFTNNTFYNCTNLTEIHFRADSQTMVEGLANYATKWGAPNANCQIYFDL